MNYTPSVPNATPTITFNPAPTPTFGGGNFTVSAQTTNTDSSALTYNVVSGPCALVSNSTFSSSGAGACEVRANGAATANFNAASNTQIVMIDKADATVSVTGYTGAYDGQAHGAGGTATGVKGESLTSLLDLGASFTNVPGGTAEWSFAGNENYNPKNGAVAIVINKAQATVTVTGGEYTYDGQPHSATGSATGVGGAALPGLKLGEAFTNVPGGTVHWTFDGGINYESAQGTVVIKINKATQTIDVTAPAPANALYNTTFTVAATGGASGNPVEYGATGACSNQGATFTMTSGYGTCTVTFEQAGNNNYLAAAPVVQTVAALAWQVKGFYSPVTPSVLGSPIWNVVKAGSTVPLKFEIFAGVNGAEQTSLSAIKNGVMSLQAVSCSGGAALEVAADQLADSGGTSLRYDGTQFIQNWKTAAGSKGCYMVTMTAADGSSIYAYFQMK